MVYAYTDETGYDGISEGSIVTTVLLDETDLPVANPPETLKVVAKLDGQAVNFGDLSAQKFFDMLPRVKTAQRKLTRNNISIDDDTPNGSDTPNGDDSSDDDTPNGDDIPNGGDSPNNDDIPNGNDSPNDDTPTGDDSPNGGDISDGGDSPDDGDISTDGEDSP